MLKNTNLINRKRGISKVADVTPDAALSADKRRI